jgi:hypothetical protein
MGFNDNRQEVICVPYAYGGGAVVLTACSDCGAVVVGEGNQVRHALWHIKLEKVQTE